MIPFTHHGSSRQLSEEIITYASEFSNTATTNNTIFTNNYPNRRFVPYSIATYVIANPATVTLSFGKVASTYVDWSAAVSVGAATVWANRIIAASAISRTSFGRGESLIGRLIFSAGSGTVTIRVYITGVLV